MKKIFLIFLVASCTPLTQAEKEYREYQRQEAEIAYEQLIKDCKIAGGVVVTRGRSLIDKKMAQCVDTESIRDLIGR